MADAPKRKHTLTVTVSGDSADAVTDALKVISSGLRQGVIEAGTGRSYAPDYDARYEYECDDAKSASERLGEMIVDEHSKEDNDAPK